MDTTRVLRRFRLLSFSLKVLQTDYQKIGGRNPEVATSSFLCERKFRLLDLILHLAFYSSETKGHAVLESTDIGRQHTNLDARAFGSQAVVLRTLNSLGVTGELLTTEQNERW